MTALTERAVRPVLRDEDLCVVYDVVNSVCGV